ncbi:hypothetical protein ACFCW2_11970 [Qipengyuania sp. DSG2-2]|uniref:hypothetical protein n=1 Tax=Qipengyuania sp. DGS2-2 TaxID=3349631 RepID=UPI0036D26A16
MEPGRDVIALLALDDQGTVPCVNRARFASTPLIVRQVDLALALGCKSLILLARSPSDHDALAAQHLAEAQGMRFHLLTRPQQLPSLVGEDAELVLLAPGVLTSDARLLEDLLGTQGLATVPAESDAAKGLERLDLHTAWGGALRMPGALAAQIEPLGADCELLSALPRIARSAGVAERPLPETAIESGAWLMGQSETGVLPSANSPGKEVSDPVVQPSAQALARKNWPDTVPLAAASVLVLAAMIILWFERSAIAIAVLALAMLACSVAQLLRQLEDPLRLSGGAHSKWAGMVALLPEAAAAGALGLALAHESDAVPAIFGAATALGASWLSRRTRVSDLEGLTSGAFLWLGIAALGAIGLWWLATGLATAAALGAIALELRRLRRITRS